MKIQELKIENIRGIRGEVTLRLNGENLMILGPNGSGKSSVVDSLDFLLTGTISRLSGEGTGDITQKNHGPHIDEGIRRAAVSAKILLPGLPDPVEIHRSMSKPKQLKCPDGATAVLSELEDLAKRRPHILTRREILRYIAAEPGKRAAEVQAVLDLSDIEDIRKAFVKVRNDLGKQLQTANGQENSAVAQVKATLRQSTYEDQTVLQAINEMREVMGGQPISVLLSSGIKVGLVSPTLGDRKASINAVVLKRYLENLQDRLAKPHQTAVAATEKELREVIAILKSDSGLLRALSRRELTERGLALIDETGACPLCERPWEPGELMAHLKKRLQEADSAARYQSLLKEAAGKINDFVDSTAASLANIIPMVIQSKMERQTSILRTWMADLEHLKETLHDPIEKDYQNANFSPISIQRMLAPDDAESILEQILSVAESMHSEPTQEQTAWDLLTRLEENLKAVESAKDQIRVLQGHHGRAVRLLETFEQARDKVLGQLYEEVKDRFVSMYRAVHCGDEAGFTANIEPSGAALDFAVDFYGRGMHPPRALHSEGHQDSMGLCLYLALNERLAQGALDIIVLDDVVMSVDADHRRGICTLLNRFFPGRQFLITTHDRTWANQLKSEGVVTGRNSLEFCDWHIETGPRLNEDLDIWGRIEKDLQANDVPAAAHKLRRGSEQFFQAVCHDMRAPVAFDANGRYELGDLLRGAVGNYNSLLKSAKAAANSWKNLQAMDMLKELSATFGPINERVEKEWLFVNSEVHYNNWSNLVPNDFRPVVAAFREMWELFKCHNEDCRGLLKVLRDGVTPEVVTCPCGGVNWKLTNKPKSK